MAETTLRDVSEAKRKCEQEIATAVMAALASFYKNTSAPAGTVTSIYIRDMHTHESGAKHWEVELTITIR